MQDRLNKTEALAENNEKRITNLEINQAKLDVQIQTLVGSLNSMTGTLKTFMYGTIGVLAGFIIWYIQQH